jgi:DNA-directed RNA polymerase subunit RPC12/RpoP
VILEKTFRINNQEILECEKCGSTKVYYGRFSRYENNKITGHGEEASCPKCGNRVVVSFWKAR